MAEGIREARNSDADGLIRLVGTCWAEYPGCVLDVDAEVPELRAIASHFRDRGGRFWVVDAVEGGRPASSAASAPRQPAMQAAGNCSSSTSIPVRGAAALGRDSPISSKTSLGPRRAGSSNCGLMPGSPPRTGSTNVSAMRGWPRPANCTI